MAAVVALGVVGALAIPAIAQVASEQPTDRPLGGEHREDGPDGRRAKPWKDRADQRRGGEESQQRREEWEQRRQEWEQRREEWRQRRAERLDQHLDRLVEQDRITQEKADELRERFEQGTFPPGPGRGWKWGHRERDGKSWRGGPPWSDGKAWRDGPPWKDGKVWRGGPPPWASRDEGTRDGTDG